MGVWLHLSAFIPSWDAVWGVSRGTPKYNSNVGLFQKMSTCL